MTMIEVHHCIAELFYLCCTDIKKRWAETPHALWWFHAIKWLNHWLMETQARLLMFFFQAPMGHNGSNHNQIWKPCSLTLSETSPGSVLCKTFAFSMSFRGGNAAAVMWPLAIIILGTLSVSLSACFLIKLTPASVSVVLLYSFFKFYLWLNNDLVFIVFCIHDLAFVVSSCWFFA